MDTPRRQLQFEQRETEGRVGVEKEGCLVTKYQREHERGQEQPHEHEHVRGPMLIRPAGDGALDLHALCRA